MKILSILFVGSSLVAVANAQTVSWATEGNAYALGAPDAVTGSSTLTLAGGYTDSHNYSGLAAFLGISPTMFGANQILAFEGNGGSGPVGGWESSRWEFTDGTNSIFTNFDETQVNGGSSLVLASGNLAAGVYTSYFGLPASNDVYSFVLFQVPFSFNPAGLNVGIQNGNGLSLPGEGTPDPDAIGAIVVPEPTSFLGLGAGLLLLLKRRNRA